ncbi:MAG: HEAT repeat domain-containing protein [Phycisphaerae bacterium]|nr:HEAT repeat domain-containing protein [Phycisphaerae bacterium]
MTRGRARWTHVVAFSALALTLVGPAIAGQAEIDEQMKQITGADDNARNKAREALAKMGVEPVEKLIAALGSKDEKVVNAVRGALHDIAGGIGESGPEADRQALCKILMADLGKPDRPEIRQLCVVRLLQYVGRAENIPALLKEADSDNKAMAKAAKMSLYQIVTPTGRLGGEYDRQAVCKVLAAELGNASLPKQTREYICRLMSYVGKEDVVPSLVTALSAQDIREMARWSLGRNPTDAALDALQEALGKADPKFRVGLINAIAEHKQRRSVPVLTEQLKQEDEAVRIAAMDAISKISDPTAVDILRARLTVGSDPERAAARAAWLRLGETLIESGRPVAGSVVFTEALGWKTTVQDRCAAIYGIGKAARPDALETLLNTMRTADHDDVRGAVAAALEQMASPEVVPAIVAVLTGQEKKSPLSRTKSLSAANRAALVDVLAYRKDKAGEPGAVAALKSSDEAVRIAALKCLGVIGTASAAPALAASLQKADGPERQAAVFALGRLPAPNGLTWLYDEVNKNGISDEYCCLLIQSVSERREPGSVEALGKVLSKDRPEGVRVAVYQAFGKLGQAEALPTLLKGVDKEAGKDRDAAEEAMLKLEAAATEPMIEAVAKATVPQKVALLKVLGFASNAKIKPLLLEAYKDRDAKIRSAAVEGLRRMADPSTLSVLEEAGAKGPAKGPAVAGMIRIAEKLEGSNRPEALRIYHQALKLATRDKEIKPALDRLAKLADPSSFEAILPMLSRGGAQANAAEAMMAIASKLPDDKKTAGIDALKKALAIKPNSGHAKGAMEKLRAWGVDIDIAREAGFVTHWWVVGPFPSPDKKMFDGKAFPEDKVDLAAKAKEGDTEYVWKKVHIGSSDGIMNLRETVASADNVAGYCYAEVTSPEAQNVLFKMGSDDDVVCWLNGKKIHANKVDRGIAVDADVVKTRLEKGVNRILLKILNGGSHWQMCLRITDPQNKPLKLEQRQK